MDKLLLYIILVLMQIYSILVIHIMIFVEMDKTGIFSMVLLYCKTLQKLILFCLILSVNFDQTFQRNCSWSCSGVWLLRFSCRISAFFDCFNGTAI